jgi:23S rRNA (cytidine1920-2'-O)/16S rRNA (cytidine1409-2'-O)-methyltransferase
MKYRLDNLMVRLGLVYSRSQAESYIKLGKVEVNGRIITKAGYFVAESDKIKLSQDEKYVSRAGLKLASVSEALNLDFKDKTVLDVGSSTGGFTDFVLRRSAQKVIAVDVGTKQMNPILATDKRVELHEQTDIRDFIPLMAIDIVLIDVSFISLHEILPHIALIAKPKTQIVAMLKPQFEAGATLKHRGVIKNDTVRRQILKDFELWVKDKFVVINKTDSEVAGSKGNRERFYLLKIIR